MAKYETHFPDSTHCSFDCDFGSVEYVKGDPGDSAYEIAVANGFEGTEEEWLESLKGEPGTKGADGHTPEKGVDYFTPEDVAEFKKSFQGLIDDLKQTVEQNTNDISTIFGDMQIVQNQVKQDCVKNTDYATGDKAGIVKTISKYGFKMSNGTDITIQKALDTESNNQVMGKENNYNPIVPANLDTASVAITHQTMDYSYNPNTATNEKNKLYKYGGKQPVSYDAVKEYVDNELMILRDDLINIIYSLKN